MMTDLQEYEVFQLPGELLRDWWAGLTCDCLVGCGELSLSLNIHIHIYIVTIIDRRLPLIIS